MKEKDKVSYLFEEAVNCFNQGDYRAAVAAWEEILKYDPENAQATHGIKVATERMQDGSQAGSEPEAETPTPEAAAPVQELDESFEEPAAPSSDETPGGVQFNMGDDDLGDPFAEEAPAPAPPPPAEQPDLGEPAAAEEAASGGGLDDWGLPTDHEETADESATVATPPAAPPPAGGDEDLGDLLEEEPAGEADELGWGEESSAASGGGGDDLLEDLGDLGSVGDLEDLDLPEPELGEPEEEEDLGFAERPDAESLEKEPGTDAFDFQGGDQEIGLGAPPPEMPPPPPEGAMEGELEDDDLEPDLDLEPSDASIPLARPIPRPAPMPAPAPRRSSSLGILLLLAVFVITLGVAGWFILSRFGGPEPDVPDPDNGDTPPPPAYFVACETAQLEWGQINLDAAIAAGEKCLAEGEAKGAKTESIAAVRAWLPVAKRIQDRPSEFKTRYVRSVYRVFCLRNSWRESFEMMRDLREDYPQYASEIDPFLTQVYFNYGVGSLQAENPREAIAYFNEALRYDANNRRAQELLRFASEWDNRRLDTTYKRYVDNLQMSLEGCPPR